MININDSFTFGCNISKFFFFVYIWLKEGHMTWIILDNVHVWKRIHVCFLLLLPWLSKKLSQLPIWNSTAYFHILRFGTDLKNMDRVHKTNIDFSFIRGMVKKYLTLGKIQPWLFTSALRVSVNSMPRLNFTSGTIIAHHSPQEHSIFA